MTTFLFWNINQKPLENVIKALVDEHQVDVLILAECNISPAVMLQTLNPEPPAEFHLPDSLCEKIVIYTRFAREFLEPALETDRLTIRRLKLPAKTEIILSAVHFPSKVHWSDESQSFECTELARMIGDVEGQDGHKRTILVGDLNMNPFESGVVAASGLHAVMTKDIALRRERKVQNKPYPFFYNPMWGCFGDAAEGPPGSYYYASAEHKTYFWNLFDQVLLRPDLLPLFRNDDLKILSGHSTQSFLSARGTPDSSVVSDHLPLLFKLNL